VVNCWTDPFKLLAGEGTGCLAGRETYHLSGFPTTPFLSHLSILESDASVSNSQKSVSLHSVGDINLC